MNTDTDTFETFNEGFADATGCTLSEARDAWQRWAWNQRLTAGEVREFEAGGYEAGWQQGNRYCDENSNF